MDSNHSSSSLSEQTEQDGESVENHSTRSFGDSAPASESRIESTHGESNFPMTERSKSVSDDANESPKRDVPVRKSLASERPTLDSEVEELLRFELNTALLHFVQGERPIVLENFGILCPTRKHSAQTHLMGAWGVLREEVIQTLAFEKCEDTSCIPESRFPRLVDTRELVQSVYSRLPIALQLRWSERELRRLVVTFFRNVRNEVVETGFSSQLRAVGQLYATHNRQGNSVNDWFAGADVFIVPRQVRPLSLRSVRRFPRPVLTSASEIWEAFLGAPLWQGTFSLAHSLREIGFPESVIEEFAFDPDDVPAFLFLETSQQSEKLSSSVLHKRDSNEPYVVVVTDGLRRVAKHHFHEGPPLEDTSLASRLKHELVFRIPASSLGRDWVEHLSQYAAIRGQSEDISPDTEATLGVGGSIGGRAQASSSHQAHPNAPITESHSWAPPSWVAQVLAAGALLIASERTNPLKANAALALGRSLTGGRDCRLNGIVALPCPNFPSQQLTDEGPFHFATIIGITADEAQLIASHGREHLVALLEARGFCHHTIPSRLSTLSRGFVAPKKTAS